MAAAAARQSEPRLALDSSTPRAILSMGRCVPMTPVDITNTCSASISSAAATISEVARAFSRPIEPVQALALTVLVATARMDCGLAATRSISSSTGAALTLLRVKTPAATQSTSLTTREKSSAPAFFNPACTPATRKPATESIDGLIFDINRLQYLRELLDQLIDVRLLDD